MNPAFWTQTYDQCENLLIDGITVHSRAYWNNDGMDIVDCNGALIQNCYVDATDDAICLKSHSVDAICQQYGLFKCKRYQVRNGFDWWLQEHKDHQQYYIRHVPFGYNDPGG